MTLLHALEVIVLASLCAMFFVARREWKAKEKLIERNAAMRLALRDASDELYCASAQLSHLRDRYAARCASEAAGVARKAGAA